MKYKVIGWTYYDNNEVLDSGNSIGFAERNAIIDEIRKHKYLFTGWHHQESWDGVVPILNDGRKRCFSQRGWGGVMAEAYGEMGDFDYARYAFYDHANPSELKFAPEEYDESLVEAVENEHFEVEVSDKLFEIAKISNPFYLEDIDELRYIDANDIITLKCNGEKLTYVVKDVDRNKKEKGLVHAKKLINGKYKIIITHKPENERKSSRKPLFVTKSECFNKFKEAMKEYDFDLIEQAIGSFDVKYLIEDLSRKETKKSLIKFAKEYSEKEFNSRILYQVLNYINDYNLYEEIANKTLEKNKFVYISFINYYLEQKRNMDEHILKFVSVLDPKENLYGGSIDIIYRAISLKPEDKKLRKLYYKVIKYTRHEGLYVMTGGNIFKQLRKSDKRLIEIDKYKEYDSATITKIVEYLTYPVEAMSSEIYPHYLPKIYEKKDNLVLEGTKAYQNYIKANYDLDSIMLEMMLYGIDKECYEMDKYLRGEEYSAKYVFALDLLTGFKFDLKGKAIEKYSKTYENFKDEIEYVYSEKGYK